MTQIVTMSLRDAGVRLAELHNTRDKVAVGKLLALLRSGEIRAGVQFPIGAQSYWFAIPISYWVGISTDKMRVIKFSKNKSGSGALKIQLGLFSEEVAAAVTQAHGDQLDNKAWAPVLAACSRSFEVSISQADWEDYESRIPKPSASAGPGSGRREKSGWRPALVITGAYIIKHRRETQENIKPKEAAEVIWKLCKAEEIADLPSPATIADELAKILKKAESISIK